MSLGLAFLICDNPGLSWGPPLPALTFRGPLSDMEPGRHPASQRISKGCPWNPAPRAVSAASASAATVRSVGVQMAVLCPNSGPFAETFPGPSPLSWRGQGSLCPIPQPWGGLCWF